MKIIKEMYSYLINGRNSDRNRGVLPRNIEEALALFKKRMKPGNLSLVLYKNRRTRDHDKDYVFVYSAHFLQEAEEILGFKIISFEYASDRDAYTGEDLGVIDYTCFEIKFDPSFDSGKETMIFLMMSSLEHISF